MSYKIKPTKGERFLIWRRRNKMSQVQASKHYQVSVNRYRQWEADKSAKLLPKIHIKSLAVFEICYLLRRRSGTTQRELAKKIGYSHVWLIRMEEGAAHYGRLRQHWGI